MVTYRAKFKRLRLIQMANSIFLQATMTLINSGEYISWKLPKYTSIVLSTNPDSSDYNVTSMDKAQRDRYINFKVDFDLLDWARWAEAEKLNSTCINFALNNGDELFQEKKGVRLASARSYTTFCRAMNCIKGDWSSEGNLEKILLIADGCFEDPNHIIGSLFTQFIDKKLDKLPSAKHLIEGEWKKVEKEMKDLFFQKGGYRNDIAFMVGTRLQNYVCTTLNEKGANVKQIRERFKDIFCSKEQLFSEDLHVQILRTCINEHKTVFDSLIALPEIYTKILS